MKGMMGIEFWGYGVKFMFGYVIVRFVGRVWKESEFVI